MLANEWLAGFKSKREAVVQQRTELGRWAVCPQQAKLCEQHDGEIETHDVLPETGKIVHAIAKMAIDACEQNLQEAADYFAAELPKARPDLQPQALVAGWGLANELRRFGASIVLLHEEPVTRQILPETPDRGEILITNEPDLVLATSSQESILDLDYKTGYKRRSSDEAKDDFQTCVGCWNLFGKYPQVQTIHWWYLETRLCRRAYARIEREQDELNFQTRILETVRIKLSGCDEAWPNPDKCVICPVVKWCKHVDGEIADFTKGPKEYLDQFIVRGARYDEMNNTLKAAVKEGRVIYGTDAKFQFDPNPKFLPKLETAKAEKPKKKKAKKKKAKKKSA